MGDGVEAGVSVGDRRAQRHRGDRGEEQERSPTAVRATPEEDEAGRAGDEEQCVERAADELPAVAARLLGVAAGEVRRSQKPQTRASRARATSGTSERWSRTKLVAADRCAAATSTSLAPAGVARSTQAKVQLPMSVPVKLSSQYEPARALLGDTVEMVNEPTACSLRISQGTTTTRAAAVTTAAVTSGLRRADRRGHTSTISTATTSSANLDG